MLKNINKISYIYFEAILIHIFCIHFISNYEIKERIVLIDSMFELVNIKYLTIKIIFYFCN